MMDKMIMGPVKDPDLEPSYVLPYHAPPSYLAELASLSPGSSWLPGMRKAAQPSVSLSQKVCGGPHLGLHMSLETSLELGLPGPQGQA